MTDIVWAAPDRDRLLNGKQVNVVLPDWLPEMYRCEACDLCKPAAELTGWLHDHDADETQREVGGVHRLVPVGPLPVTV